MTGDNETDGDEWEYSFSWTITSSSVLPFYTTIKKSLDNWSGGDPIEQEILKEMHKQAYQMLIERSFREG